MANQILMEQSLIQKTFTDLCIVHLAFHILFDTGIQRLQERLHNQSFLRSLHYFQDIH